MSTRVPTSTYRLQIQPDFPFSAAEQAVPYLASLGISHLHLSPVLEAVPGSTHGYDVTAHDRVRAELGGEEGLRSLSWTARDHGLGLVLDIVPNHMALPAHGQLNAAWWQVLRDGPDSRYARWFDIDWAAGDGRVLLPVLGGAPADELSALTVVDGELRYYDHTFPLRPGTEHLALPESLDAQHYRLAWWRLAATELNYRRFFTISELAGLRVEDPEVFDATHVTILRLLRDGVVDGLRIDHPDGLADPAGYLARLREAGGERWTVVEKILAPDEPLPRGWACSGTTGYDALRVIDGLFVDPDGVRRLADIYREYTGVSPDRGGEWRPTARRAGYRVVTRDLAAEVDRLGRAAVRACPGHSPEAVRTAIREVLVRMPVYRPYRDDDRSAGVLDEVAARARRAAGTPAEAQAVDVVRDLALRRLGGDDGDGGSERDRDREDFAVRFAQVAAAARAKSLEDCAFYRYVPLLSVNEVGGDPGRPGVSAAEFHTFCDRIQREWPYTGTVLSTHDTKRSSDVRAATSVLSEVPDSWPEWLAVLKERSRVEPPDQHVAYLAWQSAFGFGFPYHDRLPPAVLKAVREAGLRTSWTEGDADYERAVEQFVSDGPCGGALYWMAEFFSGVSPHIRANVLGTVLLHLTMPGVPDLYQGTESSYAALVDPDNRSPAQFTHPLPDRLEDPRSGQRDEKRLLTAHALRLRRERPEVFGADGDYRPLLAEGPAAAHLVAFCRAGEVVSAVTRLSHRLLEAGGWRDTALTLPPGVWRDPLTGGEHQGTVLVEELFAERPVALLRRE